MGTTDAEAPAGAGASMGADMGALLHEVRTLRADMAASGNSFRVMVRVVRKQWFLTGMVLAVVFAAIYPEASRKEAPLYPQYTVKYGAVGIIFLLSGLSLKTRQLGASALAVKYNTYFFLWVFAVSPLAWFAVRSALLASDWFSNDALLDGLVVMGVLPSTISSQIVLTQSMSGNDAASLFNATFTNLVGVILSPALLLLLLGNSGSLSFVSILVNLALSVVVPLLLGQIIQFFFADQLKAAKIPYSYISKTILLIIIFFTFAKTFDEGVDLQWRAVLGILFILVAVHAGLQYAVLASSRIPFLGFTRADSAAAFAGAVHKTVAVGISIINVMYEDSADLGVITIPLLIYHPMQLFFAGSFVTKLRNWVLADPNRVVVDDDDDDDANDGNIAYQPLLQPSSYSAGSSSSATTTDDTSSTISS